MKTILIVEDDDVIRGILLDLLYEKYECNTASSAEESLAYIEIESYDGVLTDISMAGLTGLHLMDRIHRKDVNTPVILISGKGNEQDSKSLIELGAFAFVTKPFALDQIEALVERALNHESS